MGHSLSSGVVLEILRDQDSRDADFESRLKALDLQKAAEKQLVESLALDAEQAKKLLKGSGSVIKLAN